MSISVEDFKVLKFRLMDEKFNSDLKIINKKGEEIHTNLSVESSFGSNEKDLFKLGMKLKVAVKQTKNDEETEIEMSKLVSQYLVLIKINDKINELLDSDDNNEEQVNNFCTLILGSVYPDIKEHIECIYKLAGYKIKLPLTIGGEI